MSKQGAATLVSLTELTTTLLEYSDDLHRTLGRYVAIRQSTEAIEDLAAFANGGRHRSSKSQLLIPGQPGKSLTKNER